MAAKKVKTYIFLIVKYLRKYVGYFSNGQVFATLCLNISLLVKNNFMQLGYNWFYRPRLDYELKRYEALAFEQYLGRCEREKIVNPPLKELNIQLKAIRQFLTELQADIYLKEKKIKSIDIEKAQINYTTIKDESLLEVEQICNFLLKKIIPFKDIFENLKQQAEKEIEVIPVGICPVYWNEGWLLLKNKLKIDAFLYKNKMVLNENGNESFQTYFYKSFDYKYAESPNEIKRTLMYEYKDLPNPATYFVNSVSSYAIEETILPIAVEKVVQLNSLGVASS